MIEPFAIDADIAQASTLPGRAYTDPQIYDACRQRVFARSWQLVATIDDVRVPGQTHPFTLLEGCLDEPLLLTRDRDDALHCLSNVCTHRGTIVCEHGGIEKNLLCRYHGRRFELNGRCTFMPEFDKVVGFPGPSDDLPRVQFGTWGKFIFASLDPHVPLEDIVAPMQERLAWLDHTALRFDPTRSRDYLVAANWALYCDNYLEGFHIPFVHPTLGQAVDYGQYSTELYNWSNLQLGVGKSTEGCFDLPASSPDHGRQIAAYYWWLFPNTMINVYPWGISINIVKPLGVDRTRVSFLSFVADASKLSRGAGAELDRVEREDEAVVEAVQKGCRARLYDRGRYSPDREQGVHHFHRLLCRMLFE
ncbi:MAG: aromatic ring-hydroxylating dioxygenase subunit alpha [Planctomycetota bacterium]|nr:MAG: aromatic ring-hydroxylating dioxygenase subunit alpha [Planctomycetota bacterium]